MRATSILASLALLAACRHLPPDLEARAVAAPPVPRRVPSAEELRGAWVSRELRGALRDLGHTAVYVLGPDGRYSGAIIGDDESVPIAGAYTYENGRLSFDDGALVFDVAQVGGVLEWSSPDGFVRLARLGPRPVPGTAAGDEPVSGSVPRTRGQEPPAAGPTQASPQAGAPDPR